MSSAPHHNADRTDDDPGKTEGLTGRKTEGAARRRAGHVPGHAAVARVENRLGVVSGAAGHGIGGCDHLLGIGRVDLDLHLTLVILRV